MAPHLVLCLSLLASLVLTSAPIMSAMRGDADLLTVVLRWLVALVVARVCLGTIARLVGMYASVHAADAGTPRRRSADGDEGRPPQGT